MKNLDEKNKIKHNTILAAITTIIAVIPAMIPVGVVVTIYTFLLKAIIGTGSWIPYIDQVAFLWFPEFLRGLLSGLVAISISRYIFTIENWVAIRFATIAFWSGIVIALAIFGITMIGITLELVGIIALIIGLATGLTLADKG